MHARGEEARRHDPHHGSRTREDEGGRLHPFLSRGCASDSLGDLDSLLHAHDRQLPHAKPCQRSPRNSFVDNPDWDIIALRVPFLTVLCSGTVSLIGGCAPSLTMMTWLPLWRTALKPALERAFITSLPERTGRAIRRRPRRPPHLQWSRRSPRLFPGRARWPPLCF